MSDTLIHYLLAAAVVFLVVMIAELVDDQIKYAWNTRKQTPSKRTLKRRRQRLEREARRRQAKINQLVGNAELMMEAITKLRELER